MPANEELISVENLSTHFFTEDGVAAAVQDVSFSIKKGQTFALVGESGCGKSVTALSIMRLVPRPQGKIVNGRVNFNGENLLELSEKQMRSVRGNEIAMIFQEPMTSLNPVFTVGNQVVEAIKLHQNKSSNAAWAETIEILHKVGIAEPAQRAREYPHQMSGGMRQRVMIAMAVSCEPSLLIADEPTTALDVTIQAQILGLLDELRVREKMSLLLITHDLGIVAERADDIAVMYASRIVERCDCRSLFNEPLHPYTRGLLKSLPQLGTSQKRLPTIPGNVPEPLRFPAGCKFHPRCSIGADDKRCRDIEPRLREVRPGRCVACWHSPGYDQAENVK